MVEGQPIDAKNETLHLIMEARDPRRNIARRYEITHSLDLFGVSIVEYAWGRIGTKGQSRRAVFQNTADAHKFVTQLLRRRATAKKRIGLAYVQVA